MAEIRDRGSVLATEAGVQILKDAKGRKRNHNGKPWTYKDIEIEAGVSDKTIGRFFRREQPIDESIARSICQALEVEFQDVVEISHSSQAPFDPQEPELRWRETCRELLNQWKGLTTNVLTISNGVRFQLDEMFVPLGVVERRQKTRYHSDGGSPEQGSELYEERVTPISQNEFFEQVLRQGQSKNSQGKRVAIIGEPGAGKTTQLQKIGDWILKETDGIPIWIPLAELGTRSLEEYLLNRWLKTATSELKISQSDRDELEQLLKTGRVWLLLDAVDEMTIADALHQIAIQMNEGWLRNVRVVLTCRLNVWDAGKNALDRFDVYRNLDFEYPGEVHQFIDRWFATAPELQEKLKLALEKPGKERIRDMVKNPLRLTLLCHSWQLQQGELPETKAGLYEWFVDVFYEWNKGKVSVKLNSTQRDELNRALGELAKTAIDQKSSRFRLPEKLVRQFLGDADDEGSLFSIALELGWLNRIGIAEENPLENVYAFFHPTFQEYFAAIAVSCWDFFLNHDNQCPNPLKEYRGKDCVYRVFEPQWREVILLWLGLPQARVSDQQKKELIAALTLFNGGCGNTYNYRTLSLAAMGLGEFRDFKLAWVAIGYLTVMTCFCQIQEIEEPARDALRETNQIAALAILSVLTMKDEEEHVRRESAYLLGKLDLSIEIAVLSFTKLINDAQDEWSLWRTASKCLEIDSSNALAIRSLMQLAETANNERIRRFSIWDLGKAEPGHEAVISFFVEGIKKDGDDHYELIHELGKVGQHQPKVIDFFVGLLNSINDDEIHYDVIYGFGEVAPGNIYAIEKLEELIIESENECVLLHAACSLNQVSRGSNLIVSTLHRLLDFCKNSSYRLEAVATLLKTDSTDHIALKNLSKLIYEAQDDSTFSHIFEFLDEEFSLDDNTAIFTALVPTLICLCQNSCEETIRLSAAGHLGYIAPDNDIAIQTLSSLCQISQNKSICIDAARNLGEIIPGSKIAIETLLSIINENEAEKICIEAAYRLGEIDPDNLNAIKTLQNLSENAYETDNRGKAAKYLSEIDPGNPTAIRTLVCVAIQSEESTAWQLV